VIDMTRFVDRSDAGRQLARRLEHLRHADPVVLALPRGGVPVAHEVAASLGAPLDVLAVRKLGVPVHPELAMGAIGEGGARVLDPALIRRLRVTEQQVEAAEQREREVLAARGARLRAGRPPVDLTGRTVVIVDDGMATGATARVACQVARARGASWVVLAVPVAAAKVAKGFADADEVVVVDTPPHFRAVGLHYADFRPTTDAEAARLLADARRRAPSGAADPVTADHPVESDVGSDSDVEVVAEGVVLGAHLTVPAGAEAVVLFAHGSGSSRHSPRNRFVASSLHDVGLGTLLLDLLTADEETDRAKVFDIPLLGRRLLAATDWVLAQHRDTITGLGYFGASTGAGAALYAAAIAGDRVGAVVSRGGRPDLAMEWLDRVTAPTLLIVGSRDPAVITLNEEARARMQCPTRLAVVPGATHLFTEPGVLERVAQLSRDWFSNHIQTVPRATGGRR
jgi:putative phosphoribosyl transferase